MWAHMFSHICVTPKGAGGWSTSCWCLVAQGAGSPGCWSHAGSPAQRLRQRASLVLPGLLRRQAQDRQAQALVSAVAQHWTDWRTAGMKS